MAPLLHLSPVYRLSQDFLSLFTLKPLKSGCLKKSPQFFPLYNYTQCLCLFDSTAIPKSRRRPDLDLDPSPYGWDLVVLPYRPHAFLICPLWHRGAQTLQADPKQHETKSNI